MTNSIKNKIWIFVWLLTLGLLTYVLWNRGIPLWQKLLTISLTLFTGILNVLSRINDDYDLEFTNETVYLKKTFSKQKQYSLKVDIFHNVNGFPDGRSEAEAQPKRNGAHQERARVPPLYFSCKSPVARLRVHHAAGDYYSRL